MMPTSDTTELEPNPERPQRRILYKNEKFEIVEIQWKEGCLSALHSHGWSQCAVSVQEGIFENSLDLGGKIEKQTYSVGELVVTPVGARHEIKCVKGPGKTLHVYTPELKESADLGSFSFSLKPELTEMLELGSATDFQTLQLNLETIREKSISTQSPYFMNQLFSGVLPQSLMASELITQTKTTMATLEASPVFSKIEAKVVEALGEVIGWPEAAREGVPVPGGSAANFMAIHCARQKRFPHFKKAGMNGDILRVLASSESHYSLKKACAVLGLGTDALTYVAVDKQGRMLPQELEKHLVEQQKMGQVPLIVCATSGTTVLGAFDPVEELAVICKKHGVWLHVDAAWGGPAFFSSKLRPLVKGLEQADSITFDAHKLFGADLTCSFFLTKHAGLLLEANDVSGGDYLFHVAEASLDRGRISWQCGRRADAVGFWTIWKSLGTQGLGESVDRLLTIRDQVLTWIQQQDRLELVSTPQYLNICLRVVPQKSGVSKAQWSKHVREALKEKNLAMVNYSSDEQGSFLRLILSHPRLQFEHVQQILQWALEVQ